MKIIGINYSVNSNGVRTYTLHIAEEFNSYYTNVNEGRGCIGHKVDSIYMGEYDCSNLKEGMEIDILYDKAITTTKGTFQAIKRIEVLK